MLKTAQQYTAEKFRRDAIAGLTVAVVAVPQSMAFALLAEVDPIYGLYTVAIQAIIASLLNSSEHVAVGPTNTQSLLIASVATRLAGGQPEMFIAIGAMLAMFKGIAQMGMAVAGL